MKKTPQEILENHCPSMNNLYLDKQGRAFRDRVIEAMKEYGRECGPPCKERCDWPNCTLKGCIVKDS